MVTSRSNGSGEFSAMRAAGGFGADMLEVTLGSWSGADMLEVMLGSWSGADRRDEVMLGSWVEGSGIGQSCPARSATGHIAQQAPPRAGTPGTTGSTKRTRALRVALRLVLQVLLLPPLLVLLRARQHIAGG